MLIGPAPVQKYEFLKLPGCDVWGLLMRVEHPLAQKETIEPADLEGVPLLLSRQSMSRGRSFPAAGPKFGGFEHRRHLQSVVQRRLMVEQGMGCALTLDQLVDTMAGNDLCFRPLGRGWRRI